MEIKDLFVVRPTNEEQNDFIITIGKHLATEKKIQNKTRSTKVHRYTKMGHNRSTNRGND